MKLGVSANSCGPGRTSFVRCARFVIEDNFVLLFSVLTFVSCEGKLRVVDLPEVTVILMPLSDQLRYV